MDPTSARQPSGLGSLRLGKRLGCWLVRSCRSTTLSTVVERAMHPAEFEKQAARHILVEIVGACRKEAK